MPVTAFCYGNAEQLDCLARLNIKTMEDLWRYIAASTSPVEDANVQLVIHKRHVIGLCTHRCKKLFFDFDKLYRERGVVVGGEWPNQWITLRTPRSTQKQRVVELPPERAAPPPIYVDDEAAIAEAIRQSLAMMPPSPQIKSTTGAREVPKLKEITIHQVNGRSRRTVLPHYLAALSRPSEDAPRPNLRASGDRRLAGEQEHRPDDRRHSQDQGSLP